jgi:type VI secretion system protein ImpK
MNSMTLSAEQLSLPDRSSKFVFAQTGGMSDLLRDTALVVATLRAGGRVVSLNAFRKRCLQLLDQFGEGLDRREFARDERDEALHAQCALLDETALRLLSSSDQDSWAARPLQVEKFGKHDLGESVFKRLNDRMRDQTLRIDLLECYATILGLGLTGRYAIEGEVKRQALLDELASLIARSRSTKPIPFISRRSERSLSWMKRASFWIIAGFCCLVAALVWIGCHFSIEAKLTPVLAPLTSKPITP